MISHEPFLYTTQSHCIQLSSLLSNIHLFSSLSLSHTQTHTHTHCLIASSRYTVGWFLMDEKWKVSKKEAGLSSQASTSSSTKSLFSRSCSTRSSSSKSPLLRSLSQKSSSTSKTSIPRSFSQKNPSIGKKCTSLAKEHKARFYIMRRCVAMLVCWHKHGDS